MTEWVLQCCNSTPKFCNSLFGSVFIDNEAVLETLGEQWDLKSLKRHFLEGSKYQRRAKGMLGDGRAVG